MRHVLSCALARSPGPRSLAWAALGHLLPDGPAPPLVRNTDGLTRADVALVRQCDQADGPQAAG